MLLCVLMPGPVKLHALTLTALAADGASPIATVAKQMHSAIARQSSMTFFLGKWIDLFDPLKGAGHARRILGEFA